jgi:hypothetical protein
MTEPRTSDELFQIALQHMPDIEPEIVPGTWRWNVVDGLTGSDNLGIELGVAGGGFSRRMLNSGRFRRFWGVRGGSDCLNRFLAFYKWFSALVTPLPLGALAG